MASGGRRSGLIFIIIALVILAILAGAYLLFPMVRNQLFAPRTQAENAVSQPAQSEMTSIIITAQNIPRGSVITEGVVAVVPYPKKDIVPGTFFTDMKDVLNKQAKFDIDARIPLTESMLVTGQVGSYAAFQIPRGYVAVSIPISKLTAVSFAPVVGDHVNVIASFLVVDIDQNTQSRLPNNTANTVPPRPATETDPGSLTVTINGGADGSTVGRVDLDPTLNQPLYLVPSEKQRPRLVSHMVIQDAIILRVGKFPLDPLAKTSGIEPTPVPAAATTSTPIQPPEEMTLIVRPQDSITLNYLMLSGAKISLALRAAGDIDPAAVEAVTLQYLFQTYNIPNPPKTNFGTEPRKDSLNYPDEIAPAPAPAGNN